MRDAKLNRVGVRREAFATVLRREIARRADSLDWPRAHTAYAGLTHEIAAGGGMRADTAQRRLYGILNSEEFDLVAIETVDTILTALDLSYLLHTELRDAIVVPSCSGCGANVDEHTPGCETCGKRSVSRAKRAAALPRRGPGGLSRSGGGTKLKEAA